MKNNRQNVYVTEWNGSLKVLMLPPCHTSNSIMKSSETSLCRYVHYVFQSWVCVCVCHFSGNIATIESILKWNENLVCNPFDGKNSLHFLFLCIHINEVSNQTISVLCCICIYSKSFAKHFNLCALLSYRV